ncbi:hypothetical protein BC835DRAFT_1325792 [Cytidiella melzeri]|nr:hypothetical protein BC835DRAFT_1325792 [Cytidiella melzeri]
MNVGDVAAIVLVNNWGGHSSAAGLENIASESQSILRPSAAMAKRAPQTVPTNIPPGLTPPSPLTASVPLSSAPTLLPEPFSSSQDNTDIAPIVGGVVGGVGGLGVILGSLLLWWYLRGRKRARDNSESNERLSGEKQPVTSSPPLNGTSVDV